MKDALDGVEKDKDDLKRSLEMNGDDLNDKSRELQQLYQDLTDAKERNK